VLEIKKLLLNKKNNSEEGKELILKKLQNKEEKKGLGFKIKSALLSAAQSAGAVPGIG
jgi:hypothetical protein